MGANVPFIQSFQDKLRDPFREQQEQADEQYRIHDAEFTPNKKGAKDFFLRARVKTFLPLQRRQTLGDFLGIGAAVETADAKEAFAL